MYYYSVTQWLFFFYFYCFAGWCFESAYVSLKEKRLVNRGFMRGPFLPLYGSGAIMMLVVSIPFKDSLILVYLAGCVGATALEYVTGVTMEALFKVRYWDYSNQPFNFQGQICLGSTLAWGFLTILMTEVIHKPVEELVLSIPAAVLSVLVVILTMYISADFALSFKAALDLRDVLVKMEETRQELLRIQKRLDVIIAVANEDLSSRKEELAEEWKNSRIGELAKNWKNYSLEERLQRLHAEVTERAAEYSENAGREIQELLGQYRKNVAEHSRLKSLKDFFQRDLIRSNPTMRSRRFDEVLEELKKTVNDRRGES